MIHIHHYRTVGRTMNRTSYDGHSWIYIMECACGERMLRDPDDWEIQMERLLPTVYA